MPKNLDVIEIFLSSPSDVGAERAFVKRCAEEWNRVHGLPNGRMINILTWEDVVVPVVSGRPQGEINEQIGEAYDWFLAIIWHRIGNPTGVEISGTIEEYNIAYERYRKDGSTKLSILFKNGDIPMAQVDPDQLKRVYEFKDLSKSRGVYGEFSDQEGLRIKVLQIFQMAVSETLEKKYISKPEDNAKNGNNKIDTQEHQSSNFDDYGILDISEPFVESIVRLGSILKGWTSRAEENAKIVNGVSNDLARFAAVGSVDPNIMKSKILDIAVSMDDLSHYLEENTSEYLSRSNEAVELTNLLAEIAQDIDDESQEVSNLFVAIGGALGGMSEFENGLFSMLETVESLPRMTRPFNVSRKRFIKIHLQFAEVVARMKQGFMDALSKQSPGGPLGG